MNNDDLIKSLANNLTAVNKQSPPGIFALKYLLVMLVITALGVGSLSLRSNINEQIRDLYFLLDGAFNAALLLSGIYLTGWFSTAGRNFNHNLKYVILGIFVAVLFFNAYRLSLTTVYFKNFAIHSFDTRCFGLVMIISIFCMFIVGWATSKRIVFKPGLTGATIGLLSFSVGSFVLNMHCPLALDEHVTIYHTMLPMVSGTILGYLGGKAFLKL